MAAAQVEWCSQARIVLGHLQSTDAGSLIGVWQGLVDSVLPLLRDACEDVCNRKSDGSVPVAEIATVTALCDIYVLITASICGMIGLVGTFEGAPSTRRYKQLLPACQAALYSDDKLSAPDSITTTAEALLQVCICGDSPLHMRRCCFAAVVKLAFWPCRELGPGQALASRLHASLPTIPADVTLIVASDLLGKIRGRLAGVRGFRRRLSALLDTCMRSPAAVDVLAQRVLGGVPGTHLLEAANMLANTLFSTSQTWDGTLCRSASDQLLALLRLKLPRSAPHSARAAASQLQHGTVLTILTLWNQYTHDASGIAVSFEGCTAPVCRCVLLSLTSPWRLLGEESGLIPTGDRCIAPIQEERMDVILCSELLHQIVGCCGVVKPGALASFSQTALCMLHSLPALKASGSSCRQSVVEILLVFMRGAPESIAVNTLLEAMSSGGGATAAGAAQHRIAADMSASDGLQLTCTRCVMSIEDQVVLTKRVCSEVAQLLQAASKGGGNQHLAARVFNHLLQQYAEVRRSIAVKLQDDPSVDASLLFTDGAGIVGDAGSGMFMAARQPAGTDSEPAVSGSTANVPTETLNRRRVALLLTALACVTEEAGVCILRSAGSSLQAIGHLLSACMESGGDLDETDAELVSICLSLLTAMVMGRVALEGGGDVRALKALLPVLHALSSAQLEHLSDMAKALSVGILTYNDESQDALDGVALTGLRARLHTCSVMALEREAAFRGGALMDAAHALAEGRQPLNGSDIVQQTMVLALSLLSDEDSFVYTASIQLIFQSARKHPQEAARCLFRSLTSSTRGAAYTLKVLEGWKVALPVLGTSLFRFARPLLHHSLGGAAKPLPRDCDQELDVRAAYLSISGEVCLQLSKLGYGGQQLALAHLQDACHVACALVQRPPQFPSPAAAARDKARLELLQNSAAYCLYCLVQCLSADSLGDAGKLQQASQLAARIRRAHAAASRSQRLVIAAGHLLFAENHLQDIVQHSLQPTLSEKPAISFGIGGGKIMSA